MMRATIRAAVAGDLPAVLALLREAGLPVDGVPAHFQRFVVAEEAGRLVGCAGLELYPDTARDAALLRSLAVDPDRRGRGLGHALTRAVLDRARDEGVAEVVLLTTAAEGFFERLGFQAIPRAAVRPALWASAEFQGACPETAVAMRLTVARPAAGVAED